MLGQDKISCGATRLDAMRALLHTHDMPTLFTKCLLRLSYSGSLRFCSPSEAHSASHFPLFSHRQQLALEKEATRTYSSSSV